MVQRTGGKGISQQGRSATGVRVMNMKSDDRVSAIALVVESTPDEAQDGGEPAPERGVRRNDDRGRRRGDRRVTAMSPQDDSGAEA